MKSDLLISIERGSIDIYKYIALHLSWRNKLDIYRPCQAGPPNIDRVKAFEGVNVRILTTCSCVIGR